MSRNQTTVISRGNSFSRKWVNFLYLLAYSNILLYLIYYILYVFGLAGLPNKTHEWNGTKFELLLGCIFMPWLSIFCLYCRDRFDLVHMRDGTNGLSQFIWTALTLSFLIMMFYIFFTEILRIG